MKLRKALERAKEERDKGTTAPGQASSLETDSPESIPGKAVIQQLPPEGQKKEINKPDSDWKPPQYTDSVQYQLQPNIVEKNLGVCINPDSKEIEQYKILRTRIHNQARDRKMNTIMITSPHRNEGKTVTAINMGFVFARDLKQTVLLVDCDFKGQDIHDYLGIDSKFSLIDYFLDDTPLNELIIWPGIDKLTLISGDRTVADSSELLSSEKMENLVKEMGRRYDDRYVFFDAPPVLEHAEAIAMAPMMDGIIMVVEAGRTSRRDVQKAVSLLPQEKFLGFVLNKL
ncbi:MAG TPA: AAA family ATPase [Desulfotignum sp.]|nr:AAA family ATPase [Desulfotignum sp.]